MPVWLLLDEVEFLFYTGKENVPLDTQVSTIAHRNSVSVEMAAQAASVTAGRPKKPSPVLYRRRKGKASHRVVMSQLGHISHLGALRLVW
jgi:hypothetical protein